jgi:hypothetical protein
MNNSPRRRIFVFGSNLQGIHGSGSARYAFDHYGAEWGVGEGLTGEAYALPTKHSPAQSLSIEELEEAVARFVDFAWDNPTMDFLVTSVGCGLAGFKPHEVGPMFLLAPDNVYIQMQIAQWVGSDPSDETP